MDVQHAVQAGLDPVLERLGREARRAFIPLTSVQMGLRPQGRPEAWCIQQIAEHLLLTYTSTGRALAARMEKGEATRARASLVQKAQQFLVVQWGSFPRGRKAPVFVTPADEPVLLTGEGVASRFETELQKMDLAMCEVAKTFGTGRTMVHPVLGVMSMDQWRRFHLTHARHHFKQVMTIRNSNGI